MVHSSLAKTDGQRRAGMKGGVCAWLFFASRSGTTPSAQDCVCVCVSVWRPCSAWSTDAPAAAGHSAVRR